jgi:hypothetical protein
MITAYLLGYDKWSFNDPIQIRELTYTGNYKDMSGEYILTFFTNLPEHLFYIVYDINNLPIYIYSQGALYSSINNGETVLQIDIHTFYKC